MSRRLLHHLLPSLLAASLLCASAWAQTPQKPPPWWGISDDVTVSLYWSCDSVVGDPNPTSQVVPQWYSNPTPWTVSGSVVQIPTLAGHTGCWGINGTGSPISAALELFVDNDPHIDWVKVFWFQFDVFKGASGDIAYDIEEQLGKYGRAAVGIKTEDLGAGWERVYINAELVPQPDDEKLAWEMFENLSGTVAIDDLFVSSKCIKPRPDEEGRAMGARTSPTINLSAATLGRECTAVARTLGTAANPGTRLWVAARALTSAQPHVLFVLDNAGTVLSQVPLASAAPSSLNGVTDLAVRREYGPPPLGALLSETVYAIDDRRTTGQPVTIVAVDPTAPGTQIEIPLAGFPSVATNQRLGLAYDPTGEFGAGTFWVTAPSVLTPGWSAYEFNQAGLLIDERTGLPPQTHGYAYDEALGNFYAFSADPVPRTTGPDSRVNGYEISGFDHERTGVRFCGDLLQPGLVPGGTAAGLDVYRTESNGRSELRLMCVADLGTQQVFYELAGPYRYGYSRFGRCGMQNGPPFVGETFDVTLEGVPNTIAGVLFLGSTVANIPFSAGIQPEYVISLLPDVDSGIVLPSTEGTLVVPVPLPNTAVLNYAELFFQWIVLDSGAPGLLGFGGAGKTVVYP